MLLTPATSIVPARFGVAVPDRAHATFEVEAELSGPGTWVDLTADVLMNPSPEVQYGITGSGPLDLVARTGQFTFALNNSQANSAGKLGYYSPEHANCRPGFTVGIGVRMRYLLNSITYFKFMGWLDTIEPVAGQYLDRYTMCTVTDWLNEVAVYRPNVATQVAQRYDQVVAALVSALPRVPTSTQYDTGDSTFAFALDNAQSERMPVLTQFQQCAQSEFGRMYIKGDTTGGGRLRVERRTARLAPMPTRTFDDSMVSFKVPYQRSIIYNDVKATSHPKRADTSGTVVLFQNQSTPKVTAGATVTITGRYNDPNARAIRIGGKDMVAATSGTDYTMFSSSSGGGSDLTSQFTVVAAYGANTVVYTITNNSGSDGWITLLQARGNGLYDYDPVDNIATDATSIANQGDRPLVFDMPFQSDSVVAQSVANYIRDVYKNPASVEVTIGLVAYDNTTLSNVIPVEPGDAVVIRETLTGVAHTYFVNHVSLQFETPTIVNAEWVAQKAPVQNYWTLGVAGRSELGTTTVLAPL